MSHARLEAIAKKRHASSGLRETVSLPRRILTGGRRAFDWVAAAFVTVDDDANELMDGVGVSQHVEMKMEQYLHVWRLLSLASRGRRRLCVVCRAAARPILLLAHA